MSTWRMRSAMAPMVATVLAGRREAPSPVRRRLPQPMRMPVLNGFTAALAVVVVAAACASGPSPDAIARNQQPEQTVTTEALPEGLVVVRIDNASFRPSVLELDPVATPVVRWVNLDDVEYTIIARGKEFESPVLAEGDTWEFDFSTLEPAVYRYFITRGAQTIPGLVDTRPAQ